MELPHLRRERIERAPTLPRAGAVVLEHQKTQRDTLVLSVYFVPTREKRNRMIYQDMLGTVGTASQEY